MTQKEFTQGPNVLLRVFFFCYHNLPITPPRNISFYGRRSTNRPSWTVVPFLVKRQGFFASSWVVFWATLCCCWSRACSVCCRYCGPRCCSLRRAATSGSAVCSQSHLEQERERRGREEGRHWYKWQEFRGRQEHEESIWVELQIAL